MRRKGFTVEWETDAELFFEDLTGQSAMPPPDRGFGPEPFFDDEPGHAWRVVARAGTSVRRLQPDDVIVRRSAGDAVRGWRCMLVEDADPRVLYRRPRGRVLRDDVVVLRRVQRRPRPPGEALGEQQPLIEVCGFFGPNNVRRSEAQIRAAVVARANAEWTAWHTTAGAPRLEGDAGMFGRLIGYYVAAKRTILPDTLLAIQAAALGTINYTALLAATASAATIGTEVARIRGLLLATAPGAGVTGLAAMVEDSIRQARQAHAHSGLFRAWSAAFVSACVRGVGVAEGLEAVIPPGRTHIGKDELLLPALKHAAYTVEARVRRAATPRRRGTYHAFTPAERPPQLGDIIVQDRRDGITAAQVVTLAALRDDAITHGDIVADVDPAFVVTVGGNVGDSVRRRRYPRNATGFLVVDRQELYTQEDDAGTVPGLPAQSSAPLAGHSTARIFAVLSLVEQCAAVPGQPYGRGVLT
jgi:hypothetical protein